MHPGSRALLLLALGLSSAAAAQDVPPTALETVRSHEPLVAAAGLGGPVIGTLRPRDTFHASVSRILQTRCQSCHHTGDIAPFPLVTYEEAFGHRYEIQYMASNRLMPPWHASSDCYEFKDNPSLSTEELAAIDRWLDAGAPEGDPKEAPAPLVFGSSWKGGTPDLALAMSQSFTPDFKKGDVYRCFVMPTRLTEDRWVSTVEVLPGNRPMVHHVLLYVDTGNSADALDQKDPGPGYECFGGPGLGSNVTGLGGWAPGARPQELPEGVGLQVPKGSKVVMQVHYSARSGVVASDVTSVGLTFSRVPIRKRFITLPMANLGFRIPAGAAKHEVRAPAAGPFTVPVGVHILGVAPHMHLTGTTLRVDTTSFAGAKSCLVNVPDWDFKWQGTYFYKEPVAVPFGSKLELVATYDNSTMNPENPNNPPKDLTWGEQTTDEMNLAFIGLTLDYENLSGTPDNEFEAAMMEGVEPFWETEWAKIEAASRAAKASKPKR